MPTNARNHDATPDPRRLISMYLRAARDIDDNYKAPETRAAAAHFMAWFEGVITRGIAATTDNE
ncbi:hypothetical protein [Micromonospora sp. NBC_01813]|uniref:hypothetical protein n=1 Tax=Micromonospora sp. NBC_01813 TaxID=2975988 RepID=UPI002DDBEBD9|nr:hypothetical protein [Micromonospora sp. NBC_01813]WSA06790.1 hypothetical protein OG958_21215 [Micromonospora sp. NBC_01813]